MEYKEKNTCGGGAAADALAGVKTSADLVRYFNRYESALNAVCGALYKNSEKLDDYTRRDFRGLINSLAQKLEGFAMGARKVTTIQKLKKVSEFVDEVERARKEYKQRTTRINIQEVEIKLHQYLFRFLDSGDFSLEETADQLNRGLLGADGRAFLSDCLENCDDFGKVSKLIDLINWKGSDVVAYYRGEDAEKIRTAKKLRVAFIMGGFGGNHEEDKNLCLTKEELRDFYLNHLPEMTRKIVKG